MIGRILCALGLASGLLLASAAGPGARADGSTDGDQPARRSVAQYPLPAVRLVRFDGKKVALGPEIDDGRPVVLNFVFTSCTTICPMSSQLFERFQHALGVRHDSVHLVSVSIDPEQDTPARLRAYARKFHAERGWDFYTGSTPAVEAVERAFIAFGGDKMSHRPLTLMRAAPGKPWVRFDGFATVDQLLAESRQWTSTRTLARADR